METLVVILGGGRGTRLAPLTRYRSKPAVPLGGKYRLIDITVSNAINSGLRQIFVLTQFQSASLNRHVSNTFRFDPFSRGFVEILAAEQTEESSDWYQGTADAVRKQMPRFLSREWDYVLVLSGDHLYKMDYRPFLETHVNNRAEITVGVVPVTREAASAFGILRMEREWIVEFVEKPHEPAVLDRLELDVPTARRAGIRDMNRRFLASMGIYVFDRDVMEAVLRESRAVDFGREVIPEALEKRRVRGYSFQDYWEDIGTIGSFYHANLALTHPEPAFHLFDPNWPIYSHTRYLPPSRIDDSAIRESLVAEGCRIEGAEIGGSVIGVRSQIGRGSKVRDAVILGADFYEDWAPGRGPLGIGRNCVIERAIVDKNARIGDGCVIRNAEGVVEAEGAGYSIHEGVVIVPKNSVLAPGTTI
ncbi:MAG: glucose-1-phosphate adenylyltransferase [Deltaproteobacteria bacterium]|nr:glucose-1-phosphate adenylyltransferase [Deltaproteobacteria bacterium]